MCAFIRTHGTIHSISVHLIVSKLFLNGKKEYGGWGVNNNNRKRKKEGRQSKAKPNVFRTHFPPYHQDKLPGVEGAWTQRWEGLESHPPEVSHPPAASSISGT